MNGVSHRVGRVGGRNRVLLRQVLCVLACVGQLLLALAIQRDSEAMQQAWLTGDDQICHSAAPGSTPDPGPIHHTDQCALCTACTAVHLAGAWLASAPMLPLPGMHALRLAPLPLQAALPARRLAGFHARGPPGLV